MLRRDLETPAVFCWRPGGAGKYVSRHRLMATTGDALIRSMTARYLLALGLLSTLAAVNYLSFRAQFQAGASLLPIVEASNRQRVLLQRTALLAHELVSSGEAARRAELRSELEGAIGPLEASHFQLIRPDPAASLAARADVEAIYYKTPWLLDSEMRNYVVHVRALVGAHEEELTVLNPHFRYLRDVALSRRMQEGLEAVVTVYQRQVDARTGRLGRVATWTLGSTIGVLLLTGLAVFHPLVRRVGDALETLHQLNETLEQRVGERSAVAEARAEELARSEGALRRQSTVLKSILDSMGSRVERVGFAWERGKVRQP